MKVEFSKKFLKELKKLPPKVKKSVVDLLIDLESYEETVRPRHQSKFFKRFSGGLICRNLLVRIIHLTTTLNLYF